MCQGTVNLCLELGCFDIQHRYDNHIKHIFSSITKITFTYKEEFEDTKGAIRNRISKKNRQHNGRKKKYIYYLLSDGPKILFQITDSGLVYKGSYLAETSRVSY